MILDLTPHFNLSGSATNITYGDGDCDGNNIPLFLINPVTGEVDFTGATDDVPLWYHVTYDLPGDNIECSPNNCRSLQVTPTNCDCQNCDPIIIDCPDNPILYICYEDVPNIFETADFVTVVSGGCGIVEVQPIFVSETGSCPRVIIRRYRGVDECGNISATCDVIIHVDDTCVENSGCAEPCPCEE